MKFPPYTVFVLITLSLCAQALSLLSPRNENLLTSNVNHHTLNRRAFTQEQWNHYVCLGDEYLKLLAMTPEQLAVVDNKYIKGLQHTPYQNSEDLENNGWYATIEAGITNLVAPSSTWSNLFTEFFRIKPEGTKWMHAQLGDYEVDGEKWPHTAGYYLNSFQIEFNERRQVTFSYNSIDDAQSPAYNIRNHRGDNKDNLKPNQPSPKLQHWSEVAPFQWQNAFEAAWKKKFPNDPAPEHVPPPEWYNFRDGHNPDTVSVIQELERRWRQKIGTFNDDQMLDFLDDERDAEDFRAILGTQLGKMAPWLLFMNKNKYGNYKIDHIIIFTGTGAVTAKENQGVYCVLMHASPIIAVASGESSAESGADSGPAGKNEGGGNTT